MKNIRCYIRLLNIKDTSGTNMRTSHDRFWKNDVSMERKTPKNKIKS